MKKEFVFRIVLIVVIFFVVYQFGIHPILNISDKNNSVSGQEWSARLSKWSKADYDIIIVGGEPQGISAAISAARLGANTLLICEDSDAGGTVAGCLLPEIELPFGLDNKLLNGGILEEMHKNLGTTFFDRKYILTVEEMLKAEKSLTVLYNTTISNINMTRGNISSIELFSDGNKRVVAGRMFIDASEDGKLLDKCGVPFFTGSGDLNLENIFMPVELNFEMKAGDDTGKINSELKKLMNDKDEFIRVLKRYKPLNASTRIDELKPYFTGGGNILFSGLKLSGVNVQDVSEMKEAYASAVAEAENLSLFISGQFEQLKNWRLSRTANRMNVKESKHYMGKYTLTVNDILDNVYFKNTVAMGSYPIVMSKFAENGTCKEGKGAQYGIPLGCLVPEGVHNLLMAGPQISYSSLAATSAGTIGTSIATGEAAGAVAVFCLINSESPPFLVKDDERFDEYKNTISDKNMYLPDKKLDGRNYENWSYPAVRELITLGLVAGESKDILKYDMVAKQKDLAFIIINGIYRLDKTNYSLELDAHIREITTKDELTFDSTIAILGVLYGIDGETEEIYEKLCTQSRINSVMQMRMQERKPLTMADVYYLGAYSISSFTGKDFPR